jgi:hypothetical protein
MRTMILMLAIFVITTDTSDAQQHGHGYRANSDIAIEERLEQLEILYEQLRTQLESASTDGAETGAQASEDKELQNLLKQLDDSQPNRRRRGQAIEKNRVFKGQMRQQSQLNPEISVTGDFYGSATSSGNESVIEPNDLTDGRNHFFLRDVGINFVAPLDPFTRGKFFLGTPASGDDPLSALVEEAYMEWLNLPGGVNLKIGKYFNQFGVLNRYHDHGLPQVDRPGVLRHLFGNGNTGGLGLAGNFLVPGLWAHVNELDVEIVTGSDGFAFDDTHDSVVGVVHLKNYWDISSDTYFELGLSGAHGYRNSDAGLYTTLAGLDLSWKWVPAGRSHYSTTEIRSEIIFSRVDTATETLDRMGMYLFLNNKFGARIWGGIRFGYCELPFSIEGKTEWDISPTLDFWQSEFVMLRLQYSYTDRDYDDDDNAVLLQTVWSMGPHKHEAY